MLVSVCIPHYNRSKYLVAVLESIKNQDYPEIEVLISDDCSTDDSASLIPEYIARVEGETHVRFHYQRQPRNLGYDGNLRAALAAGRGEYLFILGNDDCLANNDSLSHLAHTLRELNYPDVAFANFCDGSPQKIVRRAQATAILGSGPAVAVRSFRSFSFVGSTVFKRTSFEEHNASKYDGSIYVQIYLAARIVASGGTLASIDEPLVIKEVKIDGHQANSYVDVLALDNRRFTRQTGGLDQVGKVAFDAIVPCVKDSSTSWWSGLIFGQLLLITYPFWLMNYREHGVYRASINLAIGCWPWNLTKEVVLAFHVKLLLLALYLIVTPLGLLFPLSLYRRVRETLFRVTKNLLTPREAVPALNQ